MKDIQIIKTEIEEITPQKAKQYLDLNYDKQRNIRKPHLGLLTKLIEEDNYIPTGSVSFAIIGGDEKVLFDGQHTLQAIVKSEKSQTMVIIYWLVKDSKAMFRLYTNTDKGRIRTIDDSIKASGLIEKTGKKKIQLAHIAAGVRIILDDFPLNTFRSVKTSEEQINFMWFNKDAIIFLIENLYECGGIQVIKKLMTKKENIAILLVLCIHFEDRDVVSNFIKGIIGNITTERDDPRNIYGEFLRSLDVNRKKYRQNRIDILSKVFYINLSKMWEIYLRGGKRSRSLTPSTYKMKKDFDLAYTPFPKRKSQF
jgi:hypothetical protein